MLPGPGTRHIRGWLPESIFFVKQALADKIELPVWSDLSSSLCRHTE